MMAMEKLEGWIQGLPGTTTARGVSSTVEFGFMEWSQSWVPSFCSFK